MKTKHISLATWLLATSLLPAMVFAADLPPSFPLWPNGAPGSEARKGEAEITTPGNLVNVHNPSIVAYLPSKENATGAAVIICPGGGHRNLAIDHEGYNVGKWLSEHGIAGFVLKYRLARETNSTYKIETHALADGQRAIKLVRSRAKEWNINPSAVGIIGFSAGGEIAAMAATRADVNLGNTPDEVDQQKSRPDFQGLFYPAIPKEMKIEKDTPPAFMVCGYGDRQNISEGLPELYLTFKRAGASAELHVYSGAGHGFGLRDSNKSPAGAWPARFEEWLRDRKFLTATP